MVRWTDVWIYSIQHIVIITGREKRPFKRNCSLYLVYIPRESSCTRWSCSWLLHSPPNEAPSPQNDVQFYEDLSLQQLWFWLWFWSWLFSPWSFFWAARSFSFSSSARAVYWHSLPPRSRNRYIYHQNRKNNLAFRPCDREYEHGNHDSKKKEKIPSWSRLIRVKLKWVIFLATLDKIP